MAKARLKVIITSLEAAPPGTAANAHLTAFANAFSIQDEIRVETLWSEVRPHALGARLSSLVHIGMKTLQHVRRGDLLYMRWHPLGAPFVLGARARGARIVLEVNGTTDDIIFAHPRLRGAKALLRHFTRTQMKVACGVVAVTDGLAAWASRHGAVKTLVVTNGAPDELASLRRNAATPNYAIFFGELARWQGLDTLLKAVTSQFWPDGVELKIIGDGQMARDVESASTEHSHVTYMGRLSRKETMTLVSGAVCSISPQTATVARNRLGVAPLKVAESLMMGVPVILSDLGGHSGILKAQGYPWVVEPDSHELLAITVANIVKADRNGKVDRAALSELASAQFSWRRLGERATAFTLGQVRTQYNSRPEDQP